MQKALLIFGIILIVVGLLLLGMGWLSRLSFYTLMDGSGDMYRRMWRMMWVYFASGGVSCILGILCLVKRRKK